MSEFAEISPRKSSISSYKYCQKKFEFEYIHQITPEFVWDKTLFGSAMHDTVDLIHKENLWDDERKYVEYLITRYKYYKSNSVITGIEVKESEDQKFEDYVYMLTGYCSKDYNREMEILLSEASFTFDLYGNFNNQNLHPGLQKKIPYTFNGAIDQLGKLDKKIAKQFFTDEQLEKAPKDYVTILRDIKTGKNGDSKILEFNDDIMVYIIACNKGVFVRNNKKIKLGNDNSFIPFAAGLYYLRDHIPYKRIPTDNKWGNERGPGMYLKLGEELNLDVIENHLMTAWRALNSHNYLQTGSATGHCYICPYTKTCLAQLQGRI